jgi:hypothetical protein
MSSPFPLLKRKRNDDSLDLRILAHTNKLAKITPLSPRVTSPQSPNRNKENQRVLGYRPLSPLSKSFIPDQENEPQQEKTKVNERQPLSPLKTNGKENSRIPSMVIPRGIPIRHSPLCTSIQAQPQSNTAQECSRNPAVNPKLLSIRRDPKFLYRGLGIETIRGIPNLACKRGNLFENMKVVVEENRSDEGIKDEGDLLDLLGESMADFKDPQSDDQNNDQWKQAENNKDEEECFKKEEKEEKEEIEEIEEIEENVEKLEKSEKSEKSVKEDIVIQHYTPRVRLPRVYCDSMDLLSFRISSLDSSSSPVIPHPLQSPTILFQHSTLHKKIQDNGKVYDIYGFKEDENFENFFETEYPNIEDQNQWDLFQERQEDWKIWTQYHFAKLRQIGMRGIPNEHRKWAWAALVENANPIAMTYAKRYETLLNQTPNREAEGQIQLDINRTFTTHKLFISGVGFVKLCLYLIISI